MFSSKKLLVLAFAFLFALGAWSATSKADVTGSFTFWIVMQPQTTSGETTKMDFDFEAELDLTVTISGLAMGHELTFGVGGVETYIATLQATLGALDIKDEFVFATPYYNVTTSYWGVGYIFDWIHPKRGHVGGTRGGPMLFVKKRVTAEISLGGVSFYNLFMLEDTNFPDPRTEDLEPEDLNNDGQYTDIDQQFAIGDIMRIRGETPSGIQVTGWTAFCADLGLYKYYPKHQLLKIFEWDYNLIKKHRWLSGTVETDCYDFGGNLNYDNDLDGLVDEDPVDGIDNDGDGLIDEDPVDMKPLLGFTKEIISISNIPFPSGIVVDILGVFSTVPYKLNYLPPIIGYPWNCPAAGTWCYLPGRTANIPFFIDTVIQVPIAGLADLLIELWTDDIDSISVDKLVITFQLPEHGWVVHWYDNNGDLTFTSDDDVVFKGGIALQDVVNTFLFAAFQPTVGLWLAELDVTLPISWPEPYGFLELLFNWCDGDNATWGFFCDPGLSDGTQGSLDFQYWSFRMYKEFAHNTFEVRARFNKYGFDEAAFIVTVLFDI